MKTNLQANLILIVFGWVLFILGIDYLSEYVFSRPTNGTIQFISIIGALTSFIWLAIKTYKLIINNLNK